MVLCSRVCATPMILSIAECQAIGVGRISVSAGPDER